MPTLTARKLYEKYSASVAYVAVRLRNGDQAIGTAFHVGDGVFITARHVVDQCDVLEIANSTRQYVPDPNGLVSINGSEERFRSISPAVGRIVKGPLFHPDPSIDVAALVVDGIECPAIPLGSHLDDWINDEAFILAQVVVMGFPPIPQSSGPLLVTASAEVNAIVDKYMGGHPHFVISAMARGGFSGGPCLVEWDFALGLVTESLVDGNKDHELGYMAVITVEPILHCLAYHKIMPSIQKEGWDGLWDSDDEPVGEL